MANEVEKKAEKQAKPVQEKTKDVKVESRPLNESIEALLDYGGFDLIKDSVDGASSMDPEAKARKSIFLSDSSKKQERAKLKNQLMVWIQLLSEHTEITDMITGAQERIASCSKVLNDNLSKAVQATHDLEVAYRSVALFYKNAERDKIRNVTFFNVDTDRLKDMENTMVIDKITEELKQNYDRLDLRENYSMLVRTDRHL